MFLNINFATVNTESQNFRPRKGNYVSKFIPCVMVRHSPGYFRPRKGNYVSKCYQKGLNMTKTTIFVPVRGIMFLNPVFWKPVFMRAEWALCGAQGFFAAWSCLLELKSARNPHKY